MMGVIGRTLALSGAVSMAFAQNIEYPCLPEGSQFPVNNDDYFCQGNDIVDLLGNGYTISAEGRLVLKPTTISCPDSTRLENGFSCLFDQYGYIQGPTGVLWLVNDAGTNLEPLTAPPGVTPDGFSRLNDGSGELLGPGGARWTLLSSNGADYVVTPSTSNGESFACPASLLDPISGLFCDDRAPQYIIGDDDSFYFRTSITDVVPLTVSGQTAPDGFTWTFSFSFTTLDGPRGFRWTVRDDGTLFKAVDQGNLGVSDVCNGGRILDPVLRCAGFGYDYIMDLDDNFFTRDFDESSPTYQELLPLKVIFTGSGTYQPPPGFVVRSDGRTLEGPQGPTGTVYSFNVGTLELVVLSAADTYLAVCPEKRLPPTFRCALASTRYVGTDDGRYGYVVAADNLDDNYDNYFVVQQGAVDGGDILVPLSAISRNSVPAGFVTLQNDDEDEPTKFRGPDDTVDNVFLLRDDLELRGTDGLLEGDFSGGECSNIEDDLPTDYTCAQSNEGSDNNYVLGPSDNFFVLRDRTLVRLRATGSNNNYAPNGFTVHCVNELGEETNDGPCLDRGQPILRGPETESDVVYTVGPSGRLLAANPEATGDILDVIGCPARELPQQSFHCPTTGTGFGYVLGCDDPRKGCDKEDQTEYYTVDRTEIPHILRRLPVINRQAPPGFEVLADQLTMRGPVDFMSEPPPYTTDPPRALVFTENSNGFLQSAEAPETGPTIGGSCELLKDDLPSNFRCVNTQPEEPEWCGNRAILSQQDEDQCDDWSTANSFGVTGGSYFSEVDESTVIVPGGNFHIVSDVDHNIYILNGFNIVRLAVTEIEAPPGFSFVAGGTDRLRGPDSITNALGWEYIILEDGTLEAVGGEEPQPTIQNDRCPEERLPGPQYSCVEDYESATAFGFFIRHETSLNLYQLTADGRSLAQLTIGNEVQIAPYGFAFDGTDSLFKGPLGCRFKKVAGKLVFRNSESGINVPQSIITASGGGDFSCEDGISVQVDIEEFDSDGSSTDVSGVDLRCSTTAGFVWTGVVGTSGPISTTEEGEGEKLMQLVGEGSNRYTLTHPSSDGVPNTPIVPSGWPTSQTLEGDYLDPNNNKYHFVYVSNGPRYALEDDLDSEVREFTAVVSYNDDSVNAYNEIL